MNEKYYAALLEQLNNAVKAKHVHWQRKKYFSSTTMHSLTLLSLHFFLVDGTVFAIHLVPPMEQFLAVPIEHYLFLADGTVFKHFHSLPPIVWTVVLPLMYSIICVSSTGINFLRNLVEVHFYEWRHTEPLTTYTS